MNDEKNSRSLIIENTDSGFWGAFPIDEIDGQIRKLIHEKIRKNKSPLDKSDVEWILSRLRETKIGFLSLTYRLGKKGKAIRLSIVGMEYLKQRDRIGIWSNFEYGEIFRWNGPKKKEREWSELKPEEAVFPLQALKGEEKARKIIQRLRRGRIKQYILELARLEDGWLDGEGIAPDREGLRRLKTAFEMHYPTDVPVPFIFPTPGGGVQMEWAIGPHEISLEIDLRNLTAEYLALNVETGQADEASVDLNATAGWETIASRIRALEKVRDA